MRGVGKSWRRGPLGSPRFLVGLGMIGAVCLLSALADSLARFDPTRSGVFPLSPPDATHWLGTDELGRDIVSRVLYGGRPSLLIGIGAAALSTLIGVPIGLVAGYVGGRLDRLTMQLVNLLISVPGLILALIITAMIGPSLTNLVLVLGFVTWPRVARLVRGQALAIRETVFVEAARAAGGGAAWIVRMHILPNTLAIIATQFSLTVAYSIFTSASLSFLGVGIPPPTPDWGGMVRSGLNYLALNPTMALAPSVAVAITVLGFFFLGSTRK
ncbi:MAG: ABC transporter permease [Alphaproteobacteria bacterium]|nr:ABC transporter permease [Alphaproteobacteria bacterium]